jgi:NAD-dependent deacetylase
MIPRAARLSADAAADRCDAFLSIGTSSLVHPAAGLAETALRNGATLIEINPNATELSERATLRLRRPAGQMLPSLLAALG